MKAHGETHFTATYMTFPRTPWNWFQHPRLRNPGLSGFC